MLHSKPVLCLQQFLQDLELPRSAGSGAFQGLCYVTSFLIVAGLQRGNDRAPLVTG